MIGRVVETQRWWLRNEHWMVEREATGNKKRMEKQTSRVERRNFLNSLFSDGLLLGFLPAPARDNHQCAILSQAKVFSYYASVFSYRLCRAWERGNDGEGSWVRACLNWMQCQRSIMMSPATTRPRVDLDIPGDPALRFSSPLVDKKKRPQQL